MRANEVGTYKFDGRLHLLDVPSSKMMELMKLAAPLCDALELGVGLDDVNDLDTWFITLQHPHTGIDIPEEFLPYLQDKYIMAIQQIDELV